jgi:hypothetical protein
MIMFSQYCNNESDKKTCQLIQDSADGIYQNLFELMTEDLRDISKKKTFFNHPYFSY